VCFPAPAVSDMDKSIYTEHIWKMEQSVPAVRGFEKSYITQSTVVLKHSTICVFLLKNRTHFPRTRVQPKVALCKKGFIFELQFFRWMSSTKPKGFQLTLQAAEAEVVVSNP